MITLIDLAAKLERRKLTSRQLVEHCLTNIDNSTGEGKRAFLAVYRERALAEADAADAARKAGRHSSPFCGIPLSIKDLFDVAGEVTRAGSHALDESAPAGRDAAIVDRLRKAGFVIVGKTNMTEFAYSGLGINAHYDTPASPWDRSRRLIPGGSSSGAAVSVSDDMAAGAIGTDTGGSTRIPAALCGITGFKPTQSRIPLDGCTPLSSSLDSIGPLANTVTCCAVLDSIMAGGSGETEEAFPQVGLRLGVLEGFATEDLDDEVADAFRNTLNRLTKRGVMMKSITLPELEAYSAHVNRGSLIGGEAYAWHRPLLETRRDFYDPWVRARIEACETFSAADYVDTVARRASCKAATAQRTAAFDALVLPTVPLLARPIADLTADTDETRRTNLMYLRNTSIANTLDAPAISIPCQQTDCAPVGLMLMGHHGRDRQLLSIAQSLEGIIRLD